MTCNITSAEHDHITSGIFMTTDSFSKQKSDYAV